MTAVIVVYDDGGDGGGSSRDGFPEAIHLLLFFITCVSLLHEIIVYLYKFTMAKVRYLFMVEKGVIQVAAGTSRRNGRKKRSRKVSHEIIREA